MTNFKSVSINTTITTVEGLAPINVVSRKEIARRIEVAVSEAGLVGIITVATKKEGKVAKAKATVSATAKKVADKAEGAWASIKAGFMKGWNKMKESAFVKSVVSGVKKAKEVVGGFIKKHWKNTALATALTLAAGTVTSGMAMALTVGAVSYGVIKGISQYNVEKDAGKAAAHGLFKSLEGLAYSAAGAFGLVYGLYYTLVGAAYAFNYTTVAWAFSTYYIVG